MDPVVVVGAGASGLCCGEELQKLNVPIRILEASHHIGGRLHTVREDEICNMAKGHKWITVTHAFDGPAGNYSFDCGAEFLHGDTTVLMKRAEVSNWRIRHLFTWAQGDGGPSASAAPDGGIGYYYLAGEKRLMRFDEMLADKDFATMHNLFAHLSEHINASPKESLASHLAKANLPPRCFGIAEAGYANTAGCPLHDLSLRLNARAERLWAANDGEHDFRVERSLGEAFIRSFKALVPSIELQHRVVKIANRSEGVEITCSKGNIIRASRCVLTVPIMMLQKEDIIFDPPLPSWKVNAISSIRCEPSIKIHLRFRRRLWPRDCHGLVCSDSAVPEIWFDETKPVGGLRNEDAHRGNDVTTADGAGNDAQYYYYATGFATGKYARALAVQNPREVVERLCAQLDSAFASLRTVDSASGEARIGRGEFSVQGDAAEALVNPSTCSAGNVSASSKADGKLPKTIATSALLQTDGSSTVSRTNGNSASRTDGSNALPKTDGSNALPKTNGSSALPKIEASSATPKTDGSVVPRTDGNSALDALCGGFVVDWGKVPSICGAYCPPTCGELPEARARYQTPLWNNKLLFAGEAANPSSYMTVQAAMESGLHAARTIARESKL
eukprot:GEMP01012972.1.p1 GENE.GEMP01012972.1~~GEMP01012972.1.p1  ORF type:complete len:617 (+),score=131.21 GEMP01012972.1:49-1899(+)